MKRLFLFFTSFFLLVYTFAQTDSCNLRISLLTCGPGEDLYSVFGHTAVRVTDESAHTDIIYNYGTFDFSDPDFYVKFVKGKLLYYVSVEQHNEFIYEYQLENRSITEQLLDLTCDEKQGLSNALQLNAREENKYYLYEFLFDNCSTRVRDILKRNSHDSIHFKNILRQPVPTFRNMLHASLDSGRLYWSKLGIDLALGSLIDRRPTNEETMFLPDYLMKGFDSAYVKDAAFVRSKKVILASMPRIKDDARLFTPINTTIFLLVIISFLTLFNKKWVSRFLDIFDVTLFLITGGIGWFLVFMWFGTEHDLTANNYNLLWAVPFHLFISFFLLKNKNRVKKYFFFSMIYYLLLIVLWTLIPQGMNPAFLPVAILLGSRSFARSRKGTING
jgi:hypothetical protein